MAKEVTAAFRIKYDCKGSRRYTTDNEDFPIQDVYIKRPFSTEVEELEITLKVKK
jgi:hypothetical protein